MKTTTTLLGLAFLIGVINAAVLVVFEFVAIEGAVWLWNDLLHADTHRWLVIPVALVLGLALTATYRLCKTPRINTETSGALMEELGKSPANLKGLSAVLAIGAVSLLAGASLGPESSLMLFAGGVSAYLATRVKGSEVKQTLMLASIGALFVAFINSLFMMVLPLLFLAQQWKKTPSSSKTQAVLVVLVAGIASYLTLHLIHWLLGTTAHAVIPPLPNAAAIDYATALLLGLVAGFLAVLLNGSVRFFSKWSLWYTNTVTFKGSSWLFGGLAGLLLGVLYFIGGPMVQFSGRSGSELLMEQGAALGVGTLLGMVAVKLLATALSAGSGYRGGLVFPAIFIGLAMGFVLIALFPGIGAAGLLVGSIAGMITAAIGSPVLGALFLIAALPYKAWPLAACAVLGTLLYGFVHTRITKKSPPKAH